MKPDSHNSGHCRPRPRRQFIRECMSCGIGLHCLHPVLFHSTARAEHRSGPLREALFWKRRPGNRTVCTLCPHECECAPGENGECRSRGNRDGTFYSLAYGRPAVISLDRIEKSPLYHFAIDEESFSIATAGCNLFCAFCQNWQYSQSGPEGVKSFDLSPDQVIARAKKNGIRSINFFYTEPVIYYEYMREIALRAKKEKMTTFCVTTGYINDEPLKRLIPLIDAFVFGLKGFNESFYRTRVGCDQASITHSLKILAQHRETTWLEIVNLLVPGRNDDTASLESMCRWLSAEIGVDVPLHFTRFEPYYKMKELAPTPPETLKRAHGIARNAGLEYVYIGNLPGSDYSSTFCPRCGTPVIERTGFTITKNLLHNGTCPCGHRLPGRWSGQA